MSHISIKNGARCGTFFSLVLIFQLMASSFYEMCLQGIMVVVSIIVDWIFVYMKIPTMIPCRRILQ